MYLPALDVVAAFGDVATVTAEGASGKNTHLDCAHNLLGSKPAAVVMMLVMIVGVFYPLDVNGDERYTILTIRAINDAKWHLAADEIRTHAGRPQCLSRAPP